MSPTARASRGIFIATREKLKSLVPFLDMANPRYAYHNRSFAVDDEFGSAQRVLEQFCVQSLAFSDVRAFFALCKGVTLKSPFSEASQTGLDKQKRSELEVIYDTKLVENRANASLNLSKRICAFRDYNRKNLVMYLTYGQPK